ncbi:carbamoyltransferase family protein [Saccharopolyspora taberi]|uniref:Carbamoyltransferase n=1 Tax=Saccharopolyspora taberi TaxID=60895 RepID=A0ABN3VFM0_9PSEU
MLCLGFSGGLNRAHENPYQLPRAFTHDGAAALVEDGAVVAAIEEERLNRIKHSNKFPEHSLRYCLRRRGARVQDVDRFAFYATEEYCNALLTNLFLTKPEMPRLDARTALAGLLSQELGGEVDPDRIVFTRHHMAHAASASCVSGFDRSLVLAIDGYGDFLSGLVARAEGMSLTEIATFPQRKSLGLLYLEVIKFIGYRQFDEYKVMGLAPYGDPAPYRAALAEVYELLPGGNYDLDLDGIVPALLDRIDVRKSGQPITQDHKNLAATLQEALETIVLHVLRHYRRETDLSRLCMGGGVALNGTMNGKIAHSGLFDDVFVQPAAHDAGCALGAALLASQNGEEPPRAQKLQHVYWGTDIGAEDDVARQLEPWGGFLETRRSADVTREVAGLVADGAVVGWVQGRSEFGPRALGNRSIVADPRPVENRRRINGMIKTREGYRPFAPSVLAEDAREYFDLPESMDEFPYMLFVVNVHEDKRALLGATTHVDGTARLQTVSREANPRYWELIKAFKDLTGVSVVLNTSFNNNVEPIVESVEDAVVSFLTTKLDHLVVGDFVIGKREPERESWRALALSLPQYVQVRQTKVFAQPDRSEIRTELRTTFDAELSVGISPELAELLLRLDGEQTLAELAKDAELDSLLPELRRMWEQRLVRLRPAPLAGAPDLPGTA